MLNTSGSSSPTETKEYKTSGKTEEEIKALSLDEDLTETKKVLYILGKGQSSQKAYVSNYYQSINNS